LRFDTCRRIKGDINCDVLSRNTSKKAEKLLTEDMNLEPNGYRLKYLPRHI